MPIAQPARALAVEHKNFATPFLGAPEDEPGVISAIVSVFNNVDAGNDRILPGFFAKSIARKLPKGVWGHDWETPIAKTLEARELHPGDPALPPELMELGGLLIKGQFNLATQRGREAYEDIKFGIIDEFSIGFRATSAETDKKTGVRDLIEGELFEWSPVLVGMNSRTRLLSIKSTKSVQPSLESTLESKVDFRSYASSVATASGALVERVKRRASIREKAGRVLNQANIDLITSVADALESNVGQLRDILARAQPKRIDESAAAAKADDDASIETPSAEPAAGAATPAVPTETNEAVEAVPEPVPGPAPSSLILSELARFEAGVAASLGVHVGS